MKTLKDLQELPNAAQPTGGQGIVLDLNGQLPQAISNGLLQLAVAGQHKVAFGTVAFSFPGGSSLSNIATVTHGLGLTPIAVIGTQMVVTSAGVLCGCQTFNYAATSFQIIAQTFDGSSPAAVSTTFAWLAIG